MRYLVAEVIFCSPCWNFWRAGIYLVGTFEEPASQKSKNEISWVRQAGRILPSRAVFWSFYLNSVKLVCFEWLNNPLHNITTSAGRILPSRAVFWSFQQRLNSVKLISQQSLQLDHHRYINITNHVQIAEMIGKHCMVKYYQALLKHIDPSIYLNWVKSWSKT